MWQSHTKLNRSLKSESISMRVLIAEKPAFAKICLSIASEIWPTENVVMVSAAFVVYASSFSFPSRSTYKNLPMVVEPTYNPDAWLKDNSGDYGIVVSSLDERGEIHHQKFKDATKLRDFLNQANSVVFAGDWDNSGVMSFDQTVASFLPQYSNKDVPAVKIRKLSNEAVRKAFLKRTTTNSDAFLSMRNAARIKRHFEYNFHLNGNVILGDLYRHITGRSGTISISKYMLLMLFYTQQAGGVKWTEAIRKMHRWPGKENSTGKASSIGSPASQQAIMQNLVDLGLLSLEEKQHVFRLTEHGNQFLQSLHKDCYDPYLPQRIDGWQELPYKEAKPLMDTYIKTFFKKQKRFQAKHFVKDGQCN